MRKYEYISVLIGLNVRDRDEQLNELGSEGWHLSAALPKHDYIEYIFARRIEDNADSN